MRPSKRAVVTASLLMLAASWGSERTGFGGAREVSQPARSVRGGILVRTARHQFEVFFYPSGVRLLPLTAAGGSVDVSRATGTATFYHPNSTSPWFSRPLRGTPGQTPATLDLPVDLSNAPATGGTVTFQLSGLVDPAEPGTTFTVPLEFVATPPASSPPTAAVPPRPPQAGPAAVPRYVYRPGSYGYGYYPYSSPSPTSPSARAYHRYAAPRQQFSSGPQEVGPGHRDWSTGRDLPLPRPWLRPMD